MDKFRVCRRLAELCDDHFGGFLRLFAGYQVAHPVHCVVLLLRQKQIVSSCTGLQRVDRREDSSSRKACGQVPTSILPVPLNSSKITSSIRLPVSTSAVARIVRLPPSLMFLAAPKNFFGICRAAGSRPPESVRPLGCHRQVVGTGQTGNAVQKDNNVTPMFHQTLCPSQYHLRHTLMMFRELVERGIDNFYIISADRFLNIRNFLRTLIDQQNESSAYPDDCCVISRRHLLHQRCLTCLGRRYDHASLSLADRTEQIHDTHGHRAAGSLQMQA